MARLFFFRSHHDVQIIQCLDKITHTISGWLFPPSIEHVGRMLQEEMAAQGVNISLDEACKHVMKYKPRWRR